MAAGGRVVSIYTARGAGSPMQERKRVLAVPDRGLEGDRYFTSNGSMSKRAVPGREITEVTLIEAEVIEHLQNEYGLDVDAPDSRRNIVTRGIELNALVGREFNFGDVRLRGASLCEPCISLVKRPENKHFLRGLVHKGGLRAKILNSGTITVDDPVLEAPA